MERICAYLCTYKHLICIRENKIYIQRLVSLVSYENRLTCYRQIIVESYYLKIYDLNKWRLLLIL